MHGFNDLSTLKWFGDDSMQACLEQWDFIIAHLEDEMWHILHDGTKLVLRY